MEVNKDVKNCKTNSYMIYRTQIFKIVLSKQYIVSKLANFISIEMPTPKNVIIIIIIIIITITVTIISIIIKFVISAWRIR